MCNNQLAVASARAERGTDAATIGEIFRRYGPAYRAKFADRMSRDQLQVMKMVERCRTGELGAALYRCDACGRDHVVPQSCGNRHCPQCQGHKAKEWLDEQLEKLLPCPYFLITFTIPHELRRFVRSHARACYQAMFRASAATLIELANNPKYVGSRRLGFTGVLHTWGRTLSYHPHVHFIVPGGAIGKDGTAWLPSRANFFVPVRAASILFRAKFKKLMAEAGLIVLGKIPQEVWAKSWVVHSKAVGDGRRALRYLAPYVYRVAISNRRIVKCEPGPHGSGRVTITYRKSGSRRYRAMELTAEEFIRRFLEHVLPRGFQKVRHYGFAHPRSKIDLEWLKMLVTATLKLVYELIVAPKPLPVVVRPTCPHCGGVLRRVAVIPASGRVAVTNSS